MRRIGDGVAEGGRILVDATRAHAEIEKNEADAAEERLRRILAEKEAERQGRRGNIFGFGKSRTKIK